MRLEDWSEKTAPALNATVRRFCAARAGETADQAKARGGRDIAALLESPFVDVWAQAGIAEILAALHERAVVGSGRD